MLLLSGYPDELVCRKSVGSKSRRERLSHCMKNSSRLTINNTDHNNHMIFTIKMLETYPSHTQSPQLSVFFSNNVRGSWAEVLVTHSSNPAVKDPIYFVRESIVITKPGRTHPMKKVTLNKDKELVVMQKEHTKLFTGQKIKVNLDVHSKQKDDIGSLLPFALSQTDVYFLHWSTNISLFCSSNVNSAKYYKMSLPGNINFVSFTVISAVPRQQCMRINTYWIQDEHTRLSQEFLTFEPTECVFDAPTKYLYSYCLKFGQFEHRKLNNTLMKTFFLFGNPFLVKCPEYTNLCDTFETNGKTLKTWVQASHLCKVVKTHLPVFTNKGDLDEFVALVKLSGHVPPITTAFIGVKRTFNSKASKLLDCVLTAVFSLQIFWDVFCLARTSNRMASAEKKDKHTMLGFIHFQLAFQIMCVVAFTYNVRCLQNVSTQFQVVNTWENRNPVAWQPQRVEPTRVLPEYTIHIHRKTIPIMYLCNKTKNSFLSDIPDFDGCNYYSSQSISFHSTNLLRFSAKRAKSALCSLMLLTNLAKPYLVEVNCSAPIVTDVLCYHSEESQEKPALTYLDTTVWEKSCVMKNNTCFKFLTREFNMSQFSSNELSVNEGSCQLAQQLEFLFEATETIFPPLSVEHCKILIVYNRLWNRYLYEAYSNTNKESTAGIFVNTGTKPMQFALRHLYECGNETYIANQFMCDGFQDCPGESDEVGCNCNNSLNYSNKCRYLDLGGGKRKCSIFYFSARNGSCHLYDSSFKAMPSKSARSIGAELTIPSQLSCNSNRSVRYNVSQICSYTLRSQHVSPCPRGEHLRKCLHFECNMMFKCPGHYCIPWHYICDGKWDCPRGTDESNIHQCRKQLRACNSMFKCRNSTACASIGNICDGNKNCPSGDDESLCTLQNVLCPSECDCLTFVIKCFNISFFESSPSLSHFNIILINQTSVSTRHINFAEAVLFTIVNSNVTAICNIVSRYNHLLLLGASSNRIAEVSGDCFSVAFDLKVINLSENLICHISQRAFAEKSKLLYLDLKMNLLTEILDNWILNTSNIKYISIKDNPLKLVGSKSFEKFQTTILDTNQFSVCCFLPKKNHCTDKIPWYISCERLLGNHSIQVTFYSVFILSLCMNLTSIFLQLFLCHKQKFSGFVVLLISVGITDIEISLYLGIISVFDTVFKGTFVLRYSDWTSSSLCFVALGVNLNFHSVSPLLLCLMSLARLMVVWYPVESKYKERNYVLRRVLAVVSVCCVVTVVLTNVGHVVLGEAPFSLCSPFLDPSNKAIVIKCFTGLVTALNYFATIFVSIIHSWLYLILRRSQAQIQAARSAQQSNGFLLAQLQFITGCNMLCWVPTGVIHSSLALEEYPIEIVFWETAVLAPLNAVMIPLIFVCTDVKKLLCVK